MGEFALTSSRSLKMIQRVFKLLISPPFLLSMLLTLAFYGEPYIPVEISQVFYTLSIFIKDCLMLFLPVVIMVYIATALKEFREKTALVILVILVFEAISNTSAVWYAYAMGHAFGGQSVASFEAHTQELQPFFSISSLKPAFWSPDKGVLLGALWGAQMSYFPKPFITRILNQSLKIVAFGLQKIFVKVVPFFAFGFLLNLSHSGLLAHAFEHYLTLISIMLVCMLVYLLFLFWLGAGFSIPKALTNFKNALPSGLIAFTSMSSAATMPYTIKAAEKNLQNPVLARMIIPATTNIQQVGDCFMNAFLCLMILISFGSPIPSLYSWGMFTLAFVVARYATTAVAGGAIFVMLAVYEEYLGFNQQQIALILALNVVLDPFVTSSNVLGNGALAVLLEKVLIKCGLTTKPTLSS